LQAWAGPATASIVIGKKVLITGATGFVGGALARALAGGGAEIWALARPDADHQRLAGLDVHWLSGDVTEPASLQGIGRGMDWVVHAAGMLGQASTPESVYQRLHVEGTHHVLQEALTAGVERVLYVSSPGVLGPITGPPATEDAPLAPSNAYERSKAAAERKVQDLFGQGLPVVIARPEFIYGPGDTHVLGLFRAVQRGLFFYIGRGRHTCHPTFIDDAVRGMLLCLAKGRPGEIYHIAGLQAITFRQLGEAMAGALGVRRPWLALPRPLAWLGAAGLESVGRLTGRTVPLSRTGVAFFSEDRRFSWHKAQAELGYHPAVDLAEGMALTVAWYRKEGLL
jgi:nucleoside-diphosphate-sugar epimerase